VGGFPAGISYSETRTHLESNVISAEGTPQWIRLVPAASENAARRTTKGLFVSLTRAAPGSLGVPPTAADFHPPLIFQRTIVISLKTGGLYLSHDWVGTGRDLTEQVKLALLTDLFRRTGWILRGITHGRGIALERQHF